MHSKILSEELSWKEEYIQNVIQLIDEGNTIPFIARYRKEMHGTMDDQLLRTLADRLQYLRNLDTRKEEVQSSIEGQEKWTEELGMALAAAKTLAEVEDIYRPYKQKRRTRATMAKEKGLAPLAETLFAQAIDCPLPEVLAQDFIDPEKGVNTVEEALAGASDIIAEEISDSAELRKQLKELYLRRGSFTSKAAEKEPEDSVYRLYYDNKLPVSRVQGYQTLAINRGEREGILKAGVALEEEQAKVTVRRHAIIPASAPMEVVAFLRDAADDAWGRLIEPSVEREIRNHLTEIAEEGAISMFALNLKPLLLQPPVKGHVTMGLDPGYRMGCKVAVVDGTGKVLDTAVVYPTHSKGKQEECLQTLAKMSVKYKVSHIAIGNGTASRETEQMTVELIARVKAQADLEMAYMIVNEAGASVYSASKLAAEEFPQFDVNLRSAVSIARRMQDPLAELVKIDPKAIGVGQYQHDMPQARLGETLDGVVEDCVNAVGVDINTASPSLLARVAGLTNATSKNLVAYREEKGVFTSRKEVLKVPKLGPKAYQQCAGFLRVPEGKNLLDNTGVHPEQYETVEKILADCGCTLEELTAEKIATLSVKELAEKCEVGVPTLEDVLKELQKPGRDPRDELPPPLLSTAVLEIKDLLAGMELQGTVRNVIDFGVFVDIGVHQDGLVHISKLPKRVTHPSEAVSVGDIVTVWVVEVDEKKKRIGLTMRPPQKKKEEG
ncbi:MAG: Tex family protein [Eubacteriales bacterium]